MFISVNKYIACLTKITIELEKIKYVNEKGINNIVPNL